VLSCFRAVVTEPQAADTVSKIKRGLEALSMASAPQQG